MWGYAFSIQHRDKAVEKFRHVVKRGPNTHEAKDSAKWLDLLKEPLKIGTVVLGTGRGARDPVVMPRRKPGKHDDKKELHVRVGESC